MPRASIRHRDARAQAGDSSCTPRLACAENLIRRGGKGLFGFGGRVRWLLSRGPARCGMMSVMLLRLAYLGVANAFALLRLLPMSDRYKDAEILALRHQITVLERQLGKTRPRFCPSDRAFL